MENKKFNSVEEEEKDFQNMLNQAAQIKSYQMSLERKEFDKLPDFYKEGLYNYSYLKNIYIQSYQIKKYTYEAIKSKGIQHLKFKEYENALEQFIKCLCVFKYIKCSNPKWNSGDGIKDCELSYFEEKGNNENEKLEISNMIKSSLLNISLVYLLTKEYKNVRDACNEVIKLDSKCVKAYYRKAKSHIDDPKSLFDDHIEAQKILEIAHKIDPENLEIKSTLEQFNKFINDEKKSEKKIYKSFYTKINKESSNTEKEKKEESKKKEDENNSGLAQIRMMNLILEICYTQKDLCERSGAKSEVKKFEKIIKQAKKYRDDLNDLIGIDFNNPSEKLINLSKKENFDLNDKNIQKYFYDLKIKLIKEINEFHENNLQLMKQENNKNIDKLNELKKANKKNKNSSSENSFSNSKSNSFEEDNYDDELAGESKNKNIPREKNKMKSLNSKMKNFNSQREKNNMNMNQNRNNNKAAENNNNEQLKSTIKLAFSGIFVFFCFYLLKIGLGYYLRNKLDIDV